MKQAREGQVHSRFEGLLEGGGSTMAVEKAHSNVAGRLWSPSLGRGIGAVVKLSCFLGIHQRMLEDMLEANRCKGREELSSPVTSGG